jgi:hypothetical protein
MLHIPGNRVCMHDHPSPTGACVSMRCLEGMLRPMPDVPSYDEMQAEIQALREELSDEISALRDAIEDVRDKANEVYQMNLALQDELNLIRPPF